MDTGLAGKRVLLTGGASGIGRAAALAFAREGSRLAVLDFDEAGLGSLEGEVAGTDGEIAVFAGDLSTASGVESGVRDALAGFGGGIDVLVNNVGRGNWRTFDDLSDADWEETFQLNFMSYVRTIRFVLPSMRQAGVGCIVNNASDLAKQPEANPMDYSVSKAAVLSLTKALARSEGPGIRVNAVSPGPIWTLLWSRPGGLADNLARLHDLPPEEAVQHELELRQLPLARIGRPEEVANVIVFLASDLASFVTGSCYGVDGGSIRGI